jgi:hypothetical protein
VTRWSRIAAIASLHPRVVTSESFEQETAALAGVQAVFCTWGMPALRGEQIARLPSLRAVFYAAGSVQGFARPFLERGIRVSPPGGERSPRRGVPSSHRSSLQGLFRNTGSQGRQEKARARPAPVATVRRWRLRWPCSAPPHGHARRVDLKVLVYDPY